jgi:hypothetical protein
MLRFFQVIEPAPAYAAPAAGMMALHRVDITLREDLPVRIRVTKLSCTIAGWRS